MKSKNAKKTIRAVAAATGVVAILLVPTGCSTAAGGTGGGGLITIGGL
ncbi:hypothetical protein ACTXG5_25140 [Mycobacterium sp. Dal123C01]|jgi:hypothetical protein